MNSISPRNHFVQHWNFFFHDHHLKLVNFFLSTLLLLKSKYCRQIIVLKKMYLDFPFLFFTRTAEKDVYAGVRAVNCGFSNVP